MAADWTPYITGGISLVGVGLSFLGARKGAKIQIESTEKSIKKDVDIAKMNIKERLIAENEVNWDNELKKLISRFIQQCFDINNGIKEAKSNTKHTKDGLNKIKRTLKTISEASETMTEIRLHIFDSSDSLGNLLLDKFVEAIQHFQKMEPIPSSELAELTELSRNYFEKKWKELTKDIN